jgi:hypothetical protein
MHCETYDHSIVDAGFLSFWATLTILVLCLAAEMWRAAHRLSSRSTARSRNGSGADLSAEATSTEAMDGDAMDGDAMDGDAMDEETMGR